MTETPSFSRFAPALNAAIFGASGGIGAAFSSLLSENPRVGSVARFSRSGADGATRFDLTDERSIADAMATITDPLDLVIVATGALQDSAMQPEKTWRALDPDAMMHAYQVNTIGPAMIAKHALPKLRQGSKTVFASLSARVGSISDNRLGGWHSYRASKTALNMLIRNFAIELGRTNKTAIAIGLHPGTVDTDLSKPFQRNVPDGKLFTAEHSAASLLSVIDGVTGTDSGNCFAYDGKKITA